MSHKITLHKNSLVIRVTINRKTSYAYLPAKVKIEHWSHDSDLPKKSHPNFKSLINYIDSVNHELDDIMNLVYSKHMSAKGAKELIQSKILGKVTNDTLISFSIQLIDEFLLKKSPGNAKWIKTAVDQFCKFNKGDVQLSDISYQMLLKFRQAKEKDQIKANSINNYLRALRAIYREAVKREIFKTSFQYPFQRGLIPSQQKTANRNISPQEIELLEKCDLGGNKQKAIDFWLIGFYLQGADFIDLANLSRFNISGEYICFNRAKTNQPVKVKITQKLNQRLRKYSGLNQNYLLPILTGPVTDSKNLAIYEQKRKQHNKHVKLAAIELGISANLTSKWLRHSWITIAKRLFIEEDIRKQAVGHRSIIGAHAIYSDDFNQHIIDAANALVIGEISINDYRIAIGQ